MTTPVAAPTRRARRRARTRSAWASVFAGLGLIVLACVITSLTPAAWHDKDAFIARGSIGEAITAGEYIVRVDEVVTTSRLIDDDEPRDGDWLAVRVTAATRTSEVGASFGLTRALIGDRIFHATENVADSITGEGLHVGAGTEGWVVFELPPDADTSAFTLEFADDISVRAWGNVVAVPVTKPHSVAELELSRPQTTEAP